MGEKSEKRLALEAEAADLGVTYPKNIGDEKLAARIETARAATGEGSGQGETVAQAGSSSDLSPPVEILGADQSSDGRIRVVGPKRGRWRAGRHFTPEPVMIDVDDLSEAELDAILDDPVLLATRVPADPE